MPTASIQVRAPAAREALAVLRVVACGVATQADLPYDRAEDAMLAMSEAASLVIGAGASGEIDADLLVRDGELHVTLACEGVGPNWPPPSWEGSLEQRVLVAVTDHIDLEPADDALVRFKVGPGPG